MKRYPLQQLIQLRAHRTEQARQRLLERQREVQLRREACTRIEGEIATLEATRAAQRRKLADPPPAGIPWPMALTQREAHIDWLQAQAVAARERLVKAHEALRAAEAAREQARTEYLRAKAREDALEKRKTFWRGEQHAAELRREDAAADELMMAGHPALRVTH